MEKTSKQIERDVFHIIKNSDLKNIIGGSFYRSGMRPKNAMTEDVVVKFLAGIDGQEQNGVVLIHIYVPNIQISDDGELGENITRIDELEEVFNTFITDLENEEYLFEKDGTPHSYSVEGIEQHFISIRLQYRRITF